MKRKFTFRHLNAIFSVLMLFVFCSARATYVPVSVTTGFNADVVANGVGLPTVSTTAAFDNTAYCLVAQDYKQTATSVLPTYYLPTSGTINSVDANTPGLSFQLASYTGNNSLKLTNTSTSGTLTLSNNTYIGDVYILAASGDGYTTCTFTVNFVGGTSQQFASINVADWFGGSSFAIQGIGRVARTSPYALGANTVDPRLYQIKLPISVSNYNKTIQSITVLRAGGSTTSSRTNVMAVAIDNQTCLPPQSLAASGTTTTTSNLTWAAVTGSAGYEYAVSTSATPPAVGTTTTNTFYNATNLFPGTAYYLHVRNKCGATSFSVWNTSSPFTTLACPSAGAPTITNNVPGSATINWPGTSTLGVVDYQYAVTSSATTPTSGWLTTSATSVNITGLTPGATYYAHVRSNCNTTQSAGLNVQFVNPFPPCLSPTINSITNINMHGAAIRWTTGLNGIAYQYVVSTSSSLPSLGTTIPDTFYNATGLSANTTYYVFVRTHCGTTNYSPWDSTHFTTSDVCIAPLTPNITNITSSSAFISWNFYPGIYGYEYLLNTNPASPGPSFSGVPVSYNAIAPLNLSSGTAYYIHLRTRCDTFNFSPWTNTLFNTPSNCNAPATPVISNISDQGATFTWQPVPGAASYEYFLGTDPNPPTFGPSTTLTHYTVSNLSPASSYYFHLRSYCSVSDQSAWKTVNFTTYQTAIGTLTGDNHFNIEVYPNPVKDLLNIEIKGKINSNARLMLVDLSGKMIKEIIVSNNNSNKVEVNMSGLTAGMYFLKYIDNKNTGTVRVQKQ